jgi:hypothetical protein
MKIEVFGIFLILVAVTAATSVVLTAQPAHAACITGKSGATACSGGPTRGASGATISNGCATGVTEKTVC